MTPLLTAFTAGALAGFAITMTVLALRGRAELRNKEKRIVHVRWYAARRVLSRATLSLAAAMRALRQEGGGAPYRDLRLAEAQRARVAWWAARREMDRAAAALEGWYAAQAANASLPGGDIDNGCLRRAVDGDDAELARLVQALHHADAAAEEWLRQTLAPRKSTRLPGLLGAGRRVFIPFRGVWNHWVQGR